MFKRQQEVKLVWMYFCIAFQWNEPRYSIICKNRVNKLKIVIFSEESLVRLISWNGRLGTFRMAYSPYRMIVDPDVQWWRGYVTEMIHCWHMCNMERKFCQIYKWILRRSKMWVFNVLVASPVSLKFICHGEKQFAGCTRPGRLWITHINHQWSSRP
jgi:hypothetical protein